MKHVDCMVCEDGKLNERVENLSFNRGNGVVVVVPSVYSVCDNCGSEIANNEQVAKNKAALQVALQEAQDEKHN